MSHAWRATEFADIVAEARAAFAALLARPGAARWWTAVVVTASSDRQAERYRAEIDSRVAAGHLPGGVRWCVVPDVEGRRMGSGGATLHALAELTRDVREPLESWWRRNRVLMIHSGGDSRRLPQYSPSGKLFGALPAETAWGETSTVFDETMALSTLWAARMESGLLVGSGDVLLTFDAAAVDWTRDGVTGVAMEQPAEVGAQHGVYVADGSGRVYTFLQKPAPADVEAAGGMLPGGLVAVDTGLLRFEPGIAAGLSELGRGEPPPLDLYEHFTWLLTGQRAAAAGFEARLDRVLRGRPFHCDLVGGEFTHIGTTRGFRAIAAGAGGVIDSVLPPGAVVGRDAVVIECELSGDLRVGRGAILHGLTELSDDIDIPDDVVVHQVPVRMQDGSAGTVIRVYGVEDNPKTSAGSGGLTWFGRDMIGVLADMGLPADLVWPGIDADNWSLWNALLFPITDPSTAWACARWFLGTGEPFSLAAWAKLPRTSLSTGAVLADHAALAAARKRRTEAAWVGTTVDLARREADLRPLVAHPPAITAVAAAGLRLAEVARQERASTTRASLLVHAATFLERAGLAEEAAEATSEAFRSVEQAVRAGSAAVPPFRQWCRDEVAVSAPARIDLGGGWSDTPPFCLDWGGTVLNLALELRGEYPIRVRVRRIADPLLRWIAEDTAQASEFRTNAELAAGAGPGHLFTIPRTALRMAGVGGRCLREDLLARGGGLEIRSSVCLPVGSGLGTSSILAAATVRALAGMQGVAMPDQELAAEVMRLEQAMTTGGGWQDQAGGIFPGAKLIMTGPGPEQRLRVLPLPWSEEKRAEFAALAVLVNTGIQRMAKNLLQQIVRSYLAREASTVQVLHSIKTLAAEMAWAMVEGEWEYLGGLLDRHWELNKVMDPNTTNGPINHLLDRVRPRISGAKLAGAGGGGFLILIAKSPQDAEALKQELGDAVVPFRIAGEGLRVSCR